MLVVYQK